MSKVYWLLLILYVCYLLVTPIECRLDFGDQSKNSPRKTNGEVELGRPIECIASNSNNGRPPIQAMSVIENEYLVVIVDNMLYEINVSKLDFANKHFLKRPNLLRQFSKGHWATYPLLEPISDPLTNAMKDQLIQLFVTTVSSGIILSILKDDDMFFHLFATINGRYQFMRKSIPDFFGIFSSNFRFQAWPSDAQNIIWFDWGTRITKNWPSIPHKQDNMWWHVLVAHNTSNKIYFTQTAPTTEQENLIKSVPAFGIAFKDSFYYFDWYRSIVWRFAVSENDWNKTQFNVDANTIPMNNFFRCDEKKVTSTTSTIFPVFHLYLILFVILIIVITLVAFFLLKMLRPNENLQNLKSTSKPKSLFSDSRSKMKSTISSSPSADKVVDKAAKKSTTKSSSSPKNMIGAGDSSSGTSKKEFSRSSPSKSQTARNTS